MPPFNSVQPVMTTNKMVIPNMAHPPIVAMTSRDFLSRFSSKIKTKIITKVHTPNQKLDIRLDKLPSPKISQL